MTNSICEYLRSWLLDTLSYEPTLQDKQVLQQHLINCEDCQHTLNMLALQILNVESVPEIDCDACNEDLAEFIDAVDQNAYQALRDYPKVWWHIANCSYCASIYEISTQLVYAEANDEITVPRYREQHASITQPASPLWQELVSLLEVTRETIQRYINPTEYVFRRSNSQQPNQPDPIVIYDESTALGNSFLIELERLSNEEYLLRVESDPFHKFQLLLILGDEQYPLILEEETQTYITYLPSSVLLDPQGPNLEIKQL